MMMNQLVPLPEPTAKASTRKGATKMFQAEVSDKVYQACKAEWRKRGLTGKQVAAWALQNFLLATNPAAAKKAGVKG